MQFLDPVAKKFLEELNASAPPPASIAGRRAAFSALWRKLAPPTIDLYRIEAMQIGGVDCIVYWPRRPDPLLAATIFYHGGGGVTLSPEDFDATSRLLAKLSDTILVVPRYRQAPEHPFPTPLDDSFAVYKTLLTNAMDIGADAARLVVCGDSAGGYLAAAVTQEARRQNIPTPLAQILLYPMLDMASAAPSRFALANFTTHESIQETIALHFGDTVLDPRASPLRADDLSDLPPALIIAVDTDCLIDEARAYAYRLRAAGVPVSYFVYEGQLHGFFSFGGIMEEGNRCLAHVASWIAHACKENVRAKPAGDVA